MARVTGYSDYYKKKSQTPSQYGSVDDEEENDQEVAKVKTKFSSDLSTEDPMRQTMVDKRKAALKRRLQVAKAKVGS
jgi:hypothetical protein